MSQRHGLIRSSHIEEHRLLSESYVGWKRCEIGDLVLNRLKAHLGVLAVANEPGVVSPDYTVVRIRSGAGLSRYFLAVLTSAACRGELATRVRGVVEGFWRLYTNDLYTVALPIPPLDEQAAIVRFLDHANRRIERFIRAKRKLIALLNEQKQAIIHRSVTRGLDPNVPLKDSGVPWLGPTPAHWKVLPLRRKWQILDCKHLTVPFFPEGIPLASVVEVRGLEVDLSHAKRTSARWYRCLIEGDRKPRRDDVVYCRNASVGSAAIVATDEDFAMGQDVCLIRSEAQSQRFLNYVLHSPLMQRQLAILSIGSTFKRINVADIKGLLVTLPPRAEQEAIWTYLDSTLRPVTVALDQAERGITLIREYRTRLVSDVVTGQLDVREAAAHLPDDEPLVPDDAEPTVDEDDDADEGEVA